MKAKGARKKETVPHEWCSPWIEEHSKCVIHGRPYVWNSNGSWIDSNTQFPCLTTPSNITAAAAAAAIASMVINSTTQKTTRAALTAVTNAAKTIKLPTTIDDNTSIDNNSTAVTEITQDQVNKINQIQANLNNYATSIDGMSSFLQKLGRKG